MRRNPVSTELPSGCLSKHIIVNSFSIETYWMNMIGSLLFWNYFSMLLQWIKMSLCEQFTESRNFLVMGEKCSLVKWKCNKSRKYVNSIRRISFFDPTYLHSQFGVEYREDCRSKGLLIVWPLHIFQKTGVFFQIFCSESVFPFSSRNLNDT